MVRRVVKFIWFWGWILALSLLGIKGAQDNLTAGPVYVSLATLAVDFAPLVALCVPAKVLGMWSKPLLPGWIIGLAAGAFFIAISLFANLYVTIVNAIPGINQWKHWPLVPYASLETGETLLLIFVGGVGIGVLLGWGFGLDLSPLVSRDAPTEPVSEENAQPGKLWRCMEFLERTALKWRREILLGLIVLFGLACAVPMGILGEYGGLPLVPPGADGTVAHLFEAFVGFLTVPIFSIGIWCGDRPGLLLRGQLVTFRERVWPHVSMGGTLTALLTGYFLSVAFFASCYALTYEHEGPRSFVDQSTHSTPRRNHIQIGDLAVLSLSSLAGGNGSPIQPASPLTRGLFLSQVLLNIAWTGGIFLTAASRVVDAKKTSSAAVIVTPLTVQASPPIPPPTLVHVHVTIRERETNAATPAVSAPTTAGSRHVWRALLIMAAAFTLLLRVLKR